MPASPVTATAFGLLCACIVLFACELLCAGPPLCVGAPLCAPLLSCACWLLHASFLLGGCVLQCACPLLFAIVLRCAGLYLPALKRLPDQLVLQAGWPRSRVGYSIVSEPFDRPCLKRWTEQLQPVSGHQGTFTVCALEISTADRLARMARLTYKFAFRVNWTRYPNASGHEAVGDCIPDLSSPIRPVKSTGPAHSRAASPGSRGIRADNFNSTRKLIFPQLYHSATTVTSCSPNGNSSAKRVASVDTTPSNTSSTPLT